jgi:tetratricopeptide (TPR) repeat protein
MTPRARIAFGLLFVIAVTTHSQATESKAGPDNDPSMAKLVLEAQTLAKGKKLQAAIEKCEKVITTYKAYYENRKEKIYCSSTSTETLGYLLKAAAVDKHDAIALSATWSNAYYLKGYALQELGRLAEARSALQLALALSPWNSQYLSELGSVYQREKNWPKAKATFEQAEDQARISPADVKAEELARARRGLGYVLVEMGRLDEAEKKYQQCLAADPKDTKAAQELEYVRGLRAKSKSH